MNIIKSILKPVVKRVYRFRAKSQLSQLRDLGNPSAGKIANALDDALNDILDPEEKRWVERIEEKRRLLNGSSAIISITDYGAGSPNLVRGDGEMSRGVVISRTVGEVSRGASKPYFWSLLLFKLIRKFAPSSCLELGTCLGISGAYQASALKLNANGRLVTMEGAKALASLAEQHFQQLGLDNVRVVVGRFQDRLDEVLAENKPVDYAFIDGHHDEKATIFYFEKLVPHCSKNAIVVFDDISWSDGMRRAWQKIGQSEVVKIHLDLGTIGICVLDETVKGKSGFQMKIV